MASDLRSRIAAACRRATQGTSSLSSSLFKTPIKGGWDPNSMGSFVPVVTGAQLHWVKDASQLCLGCVGNERKVCLLELDKCTIANHQVNKCTVPDEPFLTVITGPDKGSESVVVPSKDLDVDLIDQLLEKTETIDWAEQFTVLEAGRANSIAKLKDVNELIKSVKNHASFSTPSKRNAAADVLIEVQALTDLATLLQELGLPEYDDNGIRTNGPDILFEDKSYVTLMTDTVDKIEILTDVARTVTKILSGHHDALDIQTKPLEDLLEGLRLDFLATKSSIGVKDFSRVDPPEHLWQAVETALDTCMSINRTITNMSKVVDETRDNVDCLLLEMSKEDIDKTPTDPAKEDDGALKFLNEFKSSEPPAVTPDKNKTVSFMGVDCDHNEVLCSKCMTRMDAIDDAIINCMTRVSNLEEIKNKNIESAILIKDQIFRGRNDITAWLDKQFPVDSGYGIEGGCFVTPHYILNLITADMCSINYPKILLGDKELVRMSLKRPDATSYYALLSDKPDFMLTTKLCHGHTYLASKADTDKALFKFIPSYPDFGRSSDSESLHYRFRRSLHHVSDKQEKYIESRLADRGDGQAYTIAKHLLDDCLKFVREMLDFMEELFSACNDSFNAPSEAWDLVCNCLQDLFTKEFKPSLRFCVSQDLVDVRDSMVGVIHTAFSLNTKVRELNSTRLKNHSSTTTSHVRFVMKMAKSSNKGTAKVDTIKAEVEKLIEENQSLKKELGDSKAALKRLESRLDSHLSTYQKDKKLLAKSAGAGKAYQ